MWDQINIWDEKRFLTEGFRYKSKISVPYILKLKNVINIDEEQDLKLARIL